MARHPNIHYELCWEADCSRHKKPEVRLRHTAPPTLLLLLPKLNSKALKAKHPAHWCSLVAFPAKHVSDALSYTPTCFSDWVGTTKPPKQGSLFSVPHEDWSTEGHVGKGCKCTHTHTHNQSPAGVSQPTLFPVICRPSAGVEIKVKSHRSCQNSASANWARYLRQLLEFFHWRLWHAFYLEKKLQ